MWVTLFFLSIIFKLKVIIEDLEFGIIYIWQPYYGFESIVLVDDIWLDFLMFENNKGR